MNVGYSAHKDDSLVSIKCGGSKSGDKSVSETDIGKAALAAISYALKDEDGLLFLQCWHDREFDMIRLGWPEVPSEVFLVNT
tara:strand:- start:1421 stop:1666 length:246 start_codon:yes stop_codon:yes gene_type:complete